MSAEIASIDDHKALDRAAEHIRAGEAVIFPTDTFYALGVDPARPGALERLYRLKGRPDDKPVLLLIGEREWARRLWLMDDTRLEVLAARFWPGPLTIVAAPSASAPRLPGHGLALRLPDHPPTLGFLRRVGVPLTGTSANPTGRPAPRTAREAADFFPGGVAVVLDGGTYHGRMASTVIRLNPGGFEVLREGLIPAQAVRRALASRATEADVIVIDKPEGGS
jgi:L-threonylcarbamoyladenylate synthase